VKLGFVLFILMGYGVWFPCSSEWFVVFHGKSFWGRCRWGCLQLRANEVWKVQTEVDGACDGVFQIVLSSAFLSPVSHKACPKPFRSASSHISEKHS